MLDGGHARRDFLRAGAGWGLLCLAELVVSRDALAGVAKEHASQLLRAARDLGAQLRAGQLSATAWQSKMANVFANVDVARLARAIDLDRLLATAPKVSRGASVVNVKQSIPNAVPGAVVKVFAFEQGRANPPHAHDNMVSMHLVLRGRFRVRHFDRVRDAARYIDVRPTLDRRLKPGELTTISDQRDNVHWHVAESRGVLLDILLTGVRRAGPRTTTHLIDPDRATALPNGLLRAPRIKSVKQALARYG
ncbi:MAG: hypothetical protein KC503_12630 [Myxococcales bacterium]|nr:hypothetical protein [Myxococcales bacterium]